MTSIRRTQIKKKEPVLLITSEQDQLALLHGLKRILCAGLDHAFAETGLLGLGLRV